MRLQKLKIVSTVRTVYPLIKCIFKSCDWWVAELILLVFDLEIYSKLQLKWHRMISGEDWIDSW